MIETSLWENIAFTMPLINSWILAQLIHVALLCREHKDQITVPDLVRAQLNSNRTTVGHIFKVLVEEMKIHHSTGLVNAIIQFREYVSEHFGGDTFDIVVLDEAQVCSAYIPVFICICLLHSTNHCLPSEQVIRNPGFSFGTHYSPFGQTRGLLSPILQALCRHLGFTTIFVMGTTHSIDINSVMQSAILKDTGWTTNVVCLTSRDYIHTEQDLEGS